MDSHRQGARGARMLLAALTAGAALCGAPGLASETQWWTVDQASEHAESELRGTTVRPEGAFELGPRTARFASDSLGTIWSLALMPDGSIALGGDHGRIERWTAAKGVRPWLKLGDGQVLSLALDGDHLLAGTGPDGLIYRIGARGDTALWVRTGERYVWGLAPGKNGAWFAATGTRGRLLRIENGKSRIALDTDESNLVSIAVDGTGGVYAGGDSKGHVVHVTADGTARTVLDTPEEEVRALAVGGDGALYAAALSSATAAAATATVIATPPSGDDSGGEGGESAAPGAGIVSVPAAPRAGRAVLYRVVPDSAAAIWWTAPQGAIYALAPTREGVVAGTGNGAGVYLVPRAEGAMAWLAAPEGQITALLVDRSGTSYAASSNPGALWRLGPERATRGELLSPVFDARQFARWGHIAWRGSASGGSVALETRSGNTDSPDTTWTPWRAPDHDRIASPAGRFLQWKASLTGAATRVDAVDVAWREQNMRPRVDEVIVAPQAQAFREGELVPRSEPVTQTLPGGQKVEYSIPSASTPQHLRELPAWARGVRTVQWKAADPNGDVLRYRIEVGPSADGPWTLLDKDLESPAYSWDTHTLADGSYRVRVTASDEISNPSGESLAGTAVSQPFRVDNTPPAIEAFEARASAGEARIQGRARDAMSPLSRIEYAVDDGPWRFVTPDGGFADAPELDFHATIPALAPGVHQIGVRVVDLAGNSATRAASVTVPAAR